MADLRIKDWDGVTPVYRDPKKGLVLKVVPEGDGEHCRIYSANDGHEFGEFVSLDAWVSKAEFADCPTCGRPTIAIVEKHKWCDSYKCGECGHIYALADNDAAKAFGRELERRGRHVRERGTDIYGGDRET